MDSDLSSLFVRTMGIIVVAILAILSINFAGAWAKEELRFIWDNLSGVRYTADYESEFVESGYRVLYPPDLGFSLLVPKVGLAKQIKKTQDLQDPTVLSEGAIVFLEESSFPDGGGTTVLVGQAPKVFWEKLKINPQFYLVRYLEQGDEVVIVFGKKKFSYKVVQKEKVSEFQSVFPQEADAVFIVVGEPLSSSWITILAKR